MDGLLRRSLGHNLRRLRLARGLSQEAFADALFVHRTYLGGLERGERNPSLETVERIAEAAGVDPFALLGAAGGAESRVDARRRS